MTLKTYMGFERDNAPEAAALIFAHDRREAKRLAFTAISGWNGYAEWIDIRVREMKDSPWLFDDANPEKLAADEAHFNDNPTCCKECEHWGDELVDGLCSTCRDEMGVEV